MSKRFVSFVTLELISNFNSISLNIMSLIYYCRRTSPVTVPYSSISRQRNESTSSVGSWQMVNQSGSLRSTDSTHLFQNLRSQQNSISQESNTTLVDDDIFTYNQNAVFMYVFCRFFSKKICFVLKHPFINAWTLFECINFYYSLKLIVRLINYFVIFFFLKLDGVVTGYNPYEAIFINVIVKQSALNIKMALNYHHWVVCWVT